MRKRILLTGASGFVGRSFLAYREAIPLGRPEPETDLRDYEQVLAEVAKVSPDWVVHLAALSFVPESFDNPLETFQVNFIGTFHLLQALRETGFRGRMLYIGSGDAYGHVPAEALPITESQPLRPRNPYAVSKVAAEALCYQWSQNGPFEIVMVRPFNHVGPGQSERFAIAGFAAQLARIEREGLPREMVIGDLDVTRDYVDVRDVLRAYELLLERGVNGEVYNVCSGVERSLRSILQKLQEIAGLPVTLRVDPERLRPSEQRRVVASHEKLTAATGWQPECAFEDTLRDVLSHWRNQSQ